MLSLVCSNRPRPSVQSSLTSHGHQFWTRDVFHAAGESGKTLCGRATADWLCLDARPTQDAIADPHFCQRCATKLQLHD